MNDFRVFPKKTIEEHTQITAQYLLDGLIMQAKNNNDTNTYKLLKAFAHDFSQLDEQINLTGAETFPTQTVSLLERWEADYGIPDDIFDIADDFETRRNNLLIKIGMMGVQTEQDFIDLAKFMGFEPVEIEQGGDLLFFPLGFPIMFAPSARAARSTIYFYLPQEYNNVTFPIGFPLHFGLNQRGKLELLFKKLIPATHQAIFFYNL